MHDVRHIGNEMYSHQQIWKKYKLYARRCLATDVCMYLGNQTYFTGSVVAKQPENLRIRESFQQPV